MNYILNTNFISKPQLIKIFQYGFEHIENSKNKKFFHFLLKNLNYEMILKNSKIFFNFHNRSVLEKVNKIFKLI